MRRACSQYAALGEPVPPGSRLGAHLARCTGCREYFDSLDLLASDLDRLVAVPHPSLQFAEPIWETVRKSPKPARWGRVSLVAAAACGLACGWAVWRLTVRQEPPAPARQMASAVQKPPEEDPLPSTAPPQETHAPETVVQTPHLARKLPTHRLRWANSGRRGWANGIVRSTPRPSALPELTPAEEAARLRASGMIYESQGDPSLANAAYQASFEDRPTEETAFDMGRSAEESGDMEQALNVYAGLLDSADSKSRNEKGWTP
jgi:hypothetical protein